MMSDTDAARLSADSREAVREGAGPDFLALTAEFERGFDRTWFAPSVVDYFRAGYYAARLMPSAWQPMASAPMDGSEILTFSPRYGNIRVAQFRTGLWATVPQGWPLNPTHWMPLPPPPIPKSQEPAGESPTTEPGG
jgi:hypothetical protein